MPLNASRPLIPTPLLAAAAVVVVVVTLIVGCGTDPVASSPGGTLAARSVQVQLDVDLKAARQATARYHSFAKAQQDGYTFLFMDMCMVDESADAAGGMGYHYVNTGLLGGTPEIAKPQAVLYEPAPNGSLQLVALEYVVPAEQWTNGEPPTLFGQTFTLNGFGLWALHVWLYKENPSGMFAAWNPTVRCTNAS